MAAKKRKQNRYWLGDSKQNYRKYQADFAKKTYEGFTLRFRKKCDGDVIVAIKSLANKTDYIRTLIMQDLEKDARVIDRFPRKAGATPKVNADGKIWVIDKPAYNEVIRHEEEGHWAEPNAV